MDTRSNNLGISTIIPTYNRAKTILRAVRSALDASRDGDEIIVVDDGSTDGTRDILRPLSDRIRYLRVENRGAGAARNIGIGEARNPIVAFLDSDDEWLPDKLDIQRSLMRERPEILFSFSDFRVIDRHGTAHNNYLVRWHNDTRGWDRILNPGFHFSTAAPLPPGRKDFRVYVGDLYPLEMDTNYISTITLAVRKDPAGDALRFPEDLAVFEDWECYARVSGKGPGAYLECETAINYGHSELRLTDAGVGVKADARMKILERVWGCDDGFLSRHSGDFRKVRQRERLNYIKELLACGEMAEARRHIELLEEDRAFLKVLGLLPGFTAKHAISGARKIRKYLKNTE